jgi:hypothetical protein
MSTHGVGSKSLGRRLFALSLVIGEHVLDDHYTANYSCINMVLLLLDGPQAYIGIIIGAFMEFGARP